MHVSIASPLMQPSPNGRRVGIRIVTFEACSGFTHVTAHRIAQSPKRPLSRGSGPASYPAEPLVSYQINRQLSGWNLPPLMIRAFGAHGQKRTFAFSDRQPCDAEPPTRTDYSTADLSSARPVRAIVTFDETPATTCSVAILLAVYVAYSLAIQAMVASVGLGMSASAAPDWAGFVLCSFSLASNQTANVPARDTDRQKPSPAPQCPFCFVAAQSAGHIATAGEAPAFPAYAGLSIAAISDPIGDGAFVSEFRHRHGEPRAPPAFSV